LAGFLKLTGMLAGIIVQSVVGEFLDGKILDMHCFGILNAYMVQDPWFVPSQPVCTAH